MIHKTSVIDKKAKISNDVKIGPFCYVGPNVELADEVELISNVYIEGNTKIGKKTKIFPFASIGTQPQDLKFKNDSAIHEVAKIQGSQFVNKTVLKENHRHEALDEIFELLKDYS